MTATAEAVGPQRGISRETLRRWYSQAEVDQGRWERVPTEVADELARLKAENKRLRDTNESLAQGLDSLRGGARPPRPLIVAFVDAMAVEGFAVELICAVLTGEGCQVAGHVALDLPQLAPARAGGPTHSQRRGGDRRAAGHPGHPGAALRPGARLPRTCTGNA